MRYMFVIAALTALVLSGCGGGTQASSISTPGSPSPIKQSPTAGPTTGKAPTLKQLAARYGFRVGDTPQSRASMTLPADLSGSNLADYQRASQAVGLDLLPYRGREVDFVSYPMRDRLRGMSSPVLCTVMNGTSVIGACVVAVQGETLHVLSLPEAKEAKL